LGKRDNILIIREIDGVKSYNRVDITMRINSPFIIWHKMMWSMWNPIKLENAGGAGCHYFDNIDIDYFDYLNNYDNKIIFLHGK
jgi:hypothetical protein